MAYQLPPAFEYWARVILSRVQTHTLDPTSAIARNLASLANVPGDVLPRDWPAFRFLTSEIVAGKDVRAWLQPATAYTPAEWVIWYGPLAPRYDARVRAATWRDYWHDFLLQADTLERERQLVRSGPRSRPNSAPRSALLTSGPFSRPLVRGGNGRAS